MEGGGSEHRWPLEEASWRLASGGVRVYKLAYRRECLSDSEEKPPRMAAKTNEGGSEEASRRLASSEKGKNRAVRCKSDRLLTQDKESKAMKALSIEKPNTAAVLEQEKPAPGRENC